MEGYPGSGLRDALLEVAVLHLAEPTNVAWVLRALDSLDDLLLDHAHCEKKAAGTAMNLIFRYQEDAGIAAALSVIAREELRHFERMLGVLRERGIAFGRQRPSPYASELMREVRQGEPQRMLDTLLCCALIEARSFERMGLLADALADANLAGLYRSLLASEARHHATYLDLATARFPAEEVALHLQRLAHHEARVLRGPVPEEVRMHSV